MKITKDQSISALLSTIVSMAGAIGVIWLVVKPLLVDSIGVAMAQETTEIVKAEVSPLKAAFSVTIQQTILRLQKEIAQLERKQRTADGLTAEETNTLVDLRAQLQAQEMALEALR